MLRPYIHGYKANSAVCQEGRRSTNDFSYIHVASKDGAFYQRHFPLLRASRINERTIMARVCLPLLKFQPPENLTPVAFYFRCLPFMSVIFSLLLF
jgi:hypothetical protein